MCVCACVWGWGGARPESMVGHTVEGSHSAEEEGASSLFLVGLFNHYQGRPDGSVHILGLVLVTSNIEHGSRPFLDVSFIHR